MVSLRVRRLEDWEDCGEKRVIGRIGYGFHVQIADLDNASAALGS